MVLEHGHHAPVPDRAMLRPPHGVPSAHPDLLLRPTPQQQQQQQRAPWERDADAQLAWDGRPPGLRPALAEHGQLEGGYGGPEWAERRRYAPSAQPHLAMEEERRRDWTEGENQMQHGAPPNSAPSPWLGGEADRWGPPPPSHAVRQPAVGVHVRPPSTNLERQPAPVTL
jgi:hypothetical protein